MEKEIIVQTKGEIDFHKKQAKKKGQEDLLQIALKKIEELEKRMEKIEKKSSEK